MVLKSPLPSADTTISGFGEFPANLEHDEASRGGRSNANKTIRRSMHGRIVPPVLRNKEAIMRSAGLRTVARLCKRARSTTKPCRILDAEVGALSIMGAKRTSKLNLAALTCSCV